MNVEVDVDIKNCDTCETNDKTAVTAGSSLEPVPFPSDPIKELGVDIVGPLRKLHSQVRFAITLFGYVSK